MADNKVNFLRGTSAEYEAKTKDNDTFYYTTDTKKLYLGENEVGNGIDPKVVQAHIDNQTIHAKVWRGTQEEYNAIEPKEDDTVYIIKDSDNTLADKLIDDTSTTATDKTWSAKKINENDEVARTAINTHAGNDEIHVTAAEKEKWNAVNYSNPNLLINPDFKINQRGRSEYTAAGYTVDRWATQSNCKVTPKSGGGVRLDSIGATGTGFYQAYDGDFSGNTVTLSIKASGSGSLRIGIWDTSTKTVTLDDTPAVYSHTFEIGNDATFGMWLSANGEYAEIEWVKLELGNIATPFVPPETTTELLKCRRYYQKLCFFRVPMAYHDTSIITWFVPFVPMRAIPSVTINTDGLYLDGLPSGSPQPTDFVLAWAAGTDPASASGCIRVNCSYSSSWDTSIANGSWNAPLTSNSNSSGIVLDAEL